jgi:acetyl esterase
LSAVNDATDFLPQYPLTPAMRDVLRRMARANRPHMHQLTPQQARAAYEGGAGVLEIAKIALPRVEELQIPARDGALLAARLYAPQAQAQAQGVGEGEGRPLPVLLYLHGGGFTVGSIDTHDQLCRSLAHQAGCAVVSLDYRLAPEWQFPTASNDAWDALQWLAAQARRWGWTPPAWPWAATAPAARWPPAVPSWRAMRACRWRCSC